MSLNDRDYFLIFQYSLDGVLLFDLSNSLIKQVNQAALRFLGYDRDELIGQSYKLVVYDEFDFREEDILDRFSDDNYVLNRIKFRRKDGETVKADMTIAMIDTSDGILAVVTMRSSGGADKRRSHSLTSISRAPDNKSYIKVKHLMKKGYRFHSLIGQSEGMKQVYEEIQKLAKFNSSILIYGETGTGKELVAKEIHNASPRKGKPFIAINCAGLTETLASSQLFGHKKGSFTGAVNDQKGLIEAANTGSCFLDEIGDVPNQIQPHLLRVLQEREINRVGESSVRKIDVRFIAATNRDLKTEVEKGNFRMDLLYRIQVATIRLPPLRDRADDIPYLVGSFISEFAPDVSTVDYYIHKKVLSILCHHSWPGNVRELRSVIEYTMIHASNNVIDVENLPLELQSDSAVAGDFPIPVENSSDETLDPAAVALLKPRVTSKRRLSDDVLKEEIIDALTRTDGNRAAAAKLLGVGRTTFYRYLKRLNLDGVDS